MPANSAQDALWKRLRICEAQLRELEHRLMLVENWRKSRQVSEARTAAKHPAAPPPGNGEADEAARIRSIYGAR